MTDVGERSLPNVQETLRAYMRENSIPWTHLSGKLSVGIEMINYVRILRAMGTNSFLVMNKEEIASVLETLLNRLGILDECVSTLNRLIKYRDEVTRRAITDVASSDDAAPEQTEPPA